MRPMVEQDLNFMRPNLTTQFSLNDPEQRVK